MAVNIQYALTLTQQISQCNKHAVPAMHSKLHALLHSYTFHVT